MKKSILLTAGLAALTALLCVMSCNGGLGEKSSDGVADRFIDLFDGNDSGGTPTNPIDPCVNNPQSSPTCPGYNQCVANPQSSPTCPGYNPCIADPNAAGCGGVNPCDTNPQSSPSCPNYDYCVANPQSSPTCPGYNQCVADPQSSPTCPGYVDPCIANPSAPECGGNTPTTYKVTFNANGGSGTPPSALTVNAGSSITLPSGSGLTKSGYTFGGWTDNDCVPGVYNTSTPYAPACNVTLYAMWSTSSTPTVTYALEITYRNGYGSISRNALPKSSAVGPDIGETVTDRYSYAEGTTVSLTAKANSGYTFTGWSGASTATTNTITIKMDGNKTVTANFQQQMTNPGTGTYCRWDNDPGNCYPIGDPYCDGYCTETECRYNFGDVVTNCNTVSNPCANGYSAACCAYNSSYPGCSTGGGGILTGITTDANANKTCLMSGKDLYCQWDTGCYEINETYADPPGSTCQYLAEYCYEMGKIYTGVTNVSADNDYGAGVTCNGTAYTK